MAVASNSTVFCPRCDRKYVGKIGSSYRELLDKMKRHVEQQHPDHDPDWWDTHAADHPKDCSESE